MKRSSVEEFLSKLEGCEIYPITLIKFLLNRKRILTFFQNAANEAFEIKAVYTLDNSNCEPCKEKAPDGILCRQHTSINRVLNAKTVGYDLDTQVYFHNNEIFKQVGDKLVIVYCPHTKLITGEITDSKVRKVNPITIIDPKFTKLPEYNVKEFLSTQLLDLNLSCWFNGEFSLVTLPVDRNGQDFCLVPNKK
jgi:hypothetical protein